MTRLEEIRQRYEASTGGTWVAFSDDSGRGHTNIVTAGALRDMKVVFSLPGRDKHEADIEFTSSAHQDIPYLLALAEAAEKMEEALKAIAEAKKEPAGGSYWPARQILNELDIMHDDLEGDRVLCVVANEALAAYHRAREGQ